MFAIYAYPRLKVFFNMWKLHMLVAKECDSTYLHWFFLCFYKYEWIKIQKFVLVNICCVLDLGLAFLFPEGLDWTSYIWIYCWAMQLASWVNIISDFNCTTDHRKTPFLFFHFSTWAAQEDTENVQIQMLLSIFYNKYDK